MDSRHNGPNNDQVPLTGPSSLNPMYPTRLKTTSASASQSSLPLTKHMDGNEHIPMQPYDPEQAHPQQSRDFLSGFRNFEASYEGFDSRHATDPHLVFAQGDVPNNKLSKFYHYLLNVSIVSRWMLFIVPVLGLVWIPGILVITTFPNARVWEVGLLWWSIWLSAVWGGWWIAVAVSWLLPILLRSTIGVVAVATRRYIDWAAALHRYIALFLWSLGCWVSFNPLIDIHQQPTASTDRSVHVISLIARLLFASFLCSTILLFEKFSIQWIAGKFHERSYAERITDQKFAVKALVTLYLNSSDTGRSDTLDTKADFINPKKLFKRALKGVRAAATTTTTAFGNVASEIAGSSVLQPNSPQAVVKTALESANKSRLLARRLFYSFAKQGHDYVEVGDIARFFTSQEEADRVFRLFDKDCNGDATRDEIEMACIEFHREQLSIEHSMQDLDSAVGRLDGILMTLFFIIVILIVAVALEAEVTTLIASAGTLVLGLSWLIGPSLAEVLSSIIFLFVKHPFDVGDRINLNGDNYTVKEIRLLSTLLLDSNNVCVQAPNTMLNAMFIRNIRRSPLMSETLTFDVAYSTSFEDLETLRDKMLKFLEANARDYQTAFDVAVVDFPDQEKMILSADIKYKSNAQQGALKAKRRNRWICALKEALAEVKIFGPKGDPNTIAGPVKYTEVPWKEVQEAERRARGDQRHSVGPPPEGWRLSDKNAVLLDDSDDVYGESRELHMPSPRRNLSDTTASSTGGTMSTPRAAPPGTTQAQRLPHELP